jgi:hypothetical protein
MRAYRWLFLFVPLAAAPACANIGPAWTITGVAGTLFAPIGLGVLEALLFAARTRRWRKLPVGLFIIANYFSAFAGWLSIGLVHAAVAKLPVGWALLHFVWILAAALVLAYLLTVLIERPTFECALDREEGARQRSWRLCAGIHVISYAVVAVCCWSITGLGLYHNARPVADTSFAAGVPAWVYFLHGDELRRVRLDGSRDELVQPLPAGWQEDGAYLRLAVLPVFETDQLGLWLTSRTRGEVCLLDHLPGRVAPWPRDEHGSAVALYPASAADLRPPDEKTVSFSAYPFENSELRALPAGASWHDIIHFGVVTPLLDVGAQAATVLPGDLVVWQLGTQIAGLDFRARRWSILVDGVGPAVVLDGQG